MNKETSIKEGCKGDWRKELKSSFETDSFIDLDSFIREEYLTKKVYPKHHDIFRAFALTPLSQVRVVILGQDPYHGQNQAIGLSFSVPSGTKVPPSLKNIYKEIESDLGVKKDFTDGNLEPWANQGVFLLNAILSVVEGSPSSHQGKGWETFTDAVIKTISDKREHVVFMLWGNFARGKKDLIDNNKHLVLEAPHPSPFSVHTGFFGCKHFSQCNEYLKSHGMTEIAW